MHLHYYDRGNLLRVKTHIFPPKRFSLSNRNNKKQTMQQQQKRLMLNIAGIANKARIRSYSTVTTPPQQQQQQQVLLPKPRHVWLEKVQPCKSIPDSVRVITFLAANSSAGNLKNLQYDWETLIGPIHDDEIVDEKFELIVAANEAMLQSYLFGGLPRVINAFTTIQHTFASNEKIWVEQMTRAYRLYCEKYKYNFLMYSDSETEGTLDKVGTPFVSAVYGEKLNPKLRGVLHHLHPSVEHLMLECYAEIYPRFTKPTAAKHGFEQPPLLSLLMREFITVACLAGMNVKPQLISHLRGSLRAGASRDQVRAILDHTKLVFGEHAQNEADSVWFEFEKMRASYSPSE